MSDRFKRRQWVAIVDVRDDKAIHWTWIAAVNKTTVRLHSTPESMLYLKLFAIDGSEYDHHDRAPKRVKYQCWRLRLLRDGDKESAARYQALRRVVLAKWDDWDRLSTSDLLKVDAILSSAKVVGAEKGQQG